MIKMRGGGERWGGVSYYLIGVILKCCVLAHILREIVAPQQVCAIFSAWCITSSSDFGSNDMCGVLSVIKGIKGNKGY